MRIEPPPSVPMWRGPRPAAAAAEAPPLAPPGGRSRFHGLRVIPKTRVWVAPRLLVGQRHERVQPGVDRVDAIEHRADDLHRGYLLFPDQRRQLGRRQPGEPRVSHVGTSLSRGFWSPRRRERHPQPAPRRRGSSVSRSASPSKFEPKTARLIATPGNSTRCGAFCAYSAAETDSIRPQEGYGSGTPRPRNDSVASTRIALPSCAVQRTMNGPIVLGRMWRNAILRCRTPSARAASTYCISRIDSTLQRITRAARGVIGIQMAIITLWSAGPRAADITSASTSNGSPCRMSSTRWVTRSVLPPI